MSTGSPITWHYLDAPSVYAEVTQSQLPNLTMPHIHNKCVKKVYIMIGMSVRLCPIKYQTNNFSSAKRHTVSPLLCLKYSRVSFYDDSLLRPFSRRTEHSRLGGAHCRNSSALSLLNELLALSRCAMCFFLFYFSAVLLSWFSTHDVHQKDRKELKIKTVDVTFFLDIFWTTAWAFFNKIKSDLIDIYFFNYLCNFLYI